MPYLRFSRHHILRQLAAGVFTVSSLFATALSHADYLWLQPQAGGAQVYAGELLKPLEKLPALTDAQTVVPEGKQAPAYEQASDHFRLARGAVGEGSAGDIRFIATHAGADGVLTYYQARLGRSEIKAVNELELVPTQSGGNTFRLMFKGRPVAASQVNVDTSEGWRRILTPAKDGTVSFTPSFPGLYVLEVTARVNSGSVTLGGRKYDDVRHTATLSFEVPR
ncbi:hypothetical protein [Ottowia thiooxydans]|uniref:hypothetical protein n=1 Tax=Ottowia thiooxydans TaxID=219182 RepID=UPI00041F6D9B|nr:hypothetical protein [Ottowia thiooxydans]